MIVPPCLCKDPVTSALLVSLARSRRESQDVAMSSWSSMLLPYFLVQACLLQHRVPGSLHGVEPTF
jgi:hypothetical protein